MDAHITPRERLARLFTRIAGYFKSVADPSLGWSARLKASLKAAAASAAICFLLLLAYTLILIPFTPGIADLRKAKAETPSVLVSEDGKELAVFKRMNREWVELNEISPHVVKALIATEDHRFYEHHGVDLKRTAAGIVRTLQGRPEGGSTLTQQLARNLYPEDIGRERSITRKLKELITALKIEYVYSKQEILLTYLNTMPFLYNAFGIEMGARTYFDKSAAELDVLESATLVGMLKGTAYYNPVLRPERALERRNVVLSQMAKRGVLGQADYERLKTRPIRLAFARQPEETGMAPHLAGEVRKWMIDWADRHDYNLYSDGLVVVSTVDSRLQQYAQQAVARQAQLLQSVADGEWGVGYERQAVKNAATRPVAAPAAGKRTQQRPPRQQPVHQSGYLWKARSDLLDAFVRESSAYRNAIAQDGAPDAALKQLKSDAGFMSRLIADKTRVETGFIAIDPTNGHVKAWVGSRDFNVDQFDHVSQARRQPGSTFKPFVYGAALEDGMPEDRRFTDMAVEIPVGKGEVWKPTDISAPTGRQMTLREGLALSKNTITAQVMQQVGPKKVVNFARKLGVQSPLDPVPALALGTSPVTLLEMANAYGTIASGGELRKPIMVSRILDKDGKVLDTFTSSGRRVLEKETAYGLTDMMRGVIDQGTGRAIRAQLGSRIDVAGKTGTTQNNTDGWFILMHPQLVTGAWVGFNDARITMRSNYWGQGAHAALPIVGEVARRAMNAKLIDVAARFPQPPESFLMSLWHTAWNAIKSKAMEFFEWKKPQPAPPPARRNVLPAPPTEFVPTPRQDELDRIMTQAGETATSTEEAKSPGEAVPAGQIKPEAESPQAIAPGPSSAATLPQ